MSGLEVLSRCFFFTDALVKVWVLSEIVEIGSYETINVYPDDQVIP